MSSFDVSFVRPRPDKKGLPTIKSMQSGDASIATNVGGTNITIETVNLSKAIVLITESNSTSTGNPQYVKVRAKFTSPTNINLVREGTSSSISCEISWKVIEFNNVKSLQYGDYSLTVANSERPVTISSVNTNKSMLFFSFSSSLTSNDTIAMMCKGKILDSTTINFKSGSATIVISWFLVEFY